MTIEIYNKILRTTTKCSAILMNNPSSEQNFHELQSDITHKRNKQKSRELPPKKQIIGMILSVPAQNSQQSTTKDLKNHNYSHTFDSSTISFPFDKGQTMPPKRKAQRKKEKAIARLKKRKNKKQTQLMITMVSPTKPKI